MMNPPLPNPSATLVDSAGMPTVIWYRAFVAMWNAILGGLGAGEVRSWAPADVPSGWLRADGAAVSRDTYRVLFSAIGTSYGAGDGLTTFNLPHWTVGGVNQIIRT